MQVSIVYIPILLSPSDIRFPPEPDIQTKAAGCFSAYLCLRAHSVSARNLPTRSVPHLT